MCAQHVCVSSAAMAHGAGIWYAVVSFITLHRKTRWVRPVIVFHAGRVLERGLGPCRVAAQDRRGAIMFGVSEGGEPKGGILRHGKGEIGPAETGFRGRA